MPSTTQTQPVASSPVITQESRPVPDPTLLTTAQITRFTESLQKILETRLNAMDKAIDLLQKFNDKQPTTEAVDLKVKALDILIVEKIDGIKTQLAERQRAVENLFTSNKDAADERNRSFKEQIDQQRAASNQTAASTDGRINDIKERLVAIENRAKGAGDIWGYIVGAVGVMVAIGTLVAIVVLRTK